MDLVQFRQAVVAEKFRQLNQWGAQVHDDDRWFAIMAEEVGEVAKAVVQGKPDEMIEELVQVVAVAETWIISDSARRRKS